MSGRTKFVLDTNAVLAITKGEIIPVALANELRRSKIFVSVITRMELLVKPELTTEDKIKIHGFLKVCKVIPLNKKVEQEAIVLRKTGKPTHPKIPDAIICATAVALGAILATNDKELLALSWQGLQTVSIG